MEFFKDQKLNLYLINEKLPVQRIANKFVGITGWQNLTDFSKYSKQIKKDDNFGFLSGYQYDSKKYIEILDFDIVSKSGINSATQQLYNEFEQLDTNDKVGFFSGSTCGNYGVILDSTNDINLRNKIEECKKYNKNKCKIEELEILYCNNVVLPPSITNCKKCSRQHKHREMLNKNIGFCVPNPEQSKFIISLIDKFITSKTNKALTTITNENKPKNIICQSMTHDINRIHKDKIIKILDCLSDNRFTCKMDNGWGQLLVMIANANNSNEVITKFWNRSAIGIYSNVKYEEIHNSFQKMKIIENFNFAPLWKMAKDDNEILYNKYFHKYDEPNFEYQNIIFKDDNNNDTQFINYNQVIDYFQDTKYRFIKSGLGTGKTTFISKHIENCNDKRIIFFTMRQSLAHSINNDFSNYGFTNYLNKDSKINYIDPRIIISIDSINKIAIDDEFNIKPYDIVICDEICSLLNHFSYKEMKNPEICYKMFKNIIKSSEECYFLDGDISNREISWFNKYIKNETDDVKLPLFNTLSGLKYDLQISYCKNGQYNKFIDDLEKSKKIVIVSMSSTEAISIYNMLSTKYRCKVIHGNSSDIEKRDLQNINDIVKTLDCFIYSPTISVGVNIDISHFDNIYGYICNGSVCPRDYFQMLARIRKPKNNIVNILLAGFDIKLNGLFDIIDFNHYYRIMYDDELVNGISYIKLWNKWEFDMSSNLWLDIFKWYSERKGHKFTIVNHSKADYEKQNKIMSDNIVKYGLKINTQKCEVIYNAKLLHKKPLEITNYNPKENKLKDTNIRNELLQSTYINDEHIELLETIDERNNWDNMDIVSDRIKQSKAFTHDKYNFEKSLYYYYFGLDNNISLEDFKEYYYNKIDNVKLYNQLHNINNLIEVYPVIDYGVDFDSELCNKKIKYLNDVCRILNIGLNNDVNNKYTINNDLISSKSIIDLLGSNDYNFVFSNINKSKSSTQINDKAKTQEMIKNLTRTQVIIKLKQLFSIFCYELNYKQIKLNGTRTNIYELSSNQTIKQYINNQTNKKVKHNDDTSDDSDTEIIELDF